jgi:hypothetical protein
MNSIRRAQRVWWSEPSGARCTVVTGGMADRDVPTVLFIDTVAIFTLPNATIV